MFENGPDATFEPTTNGGQTFVEIDHHDGSERERLIHEVRSVLEKALTLLSDILHETEPLAAGEKWTIPLRISCGFEADVEIRVRRAGLCAYTTAESVARSRADFFAAGETLEAERAADMDTLDRAAEILERTLPSGLITVRGFDMGPETLDELVRREMGRPAMMPVDEEPLVVEIRDGVSITPEQADRLIAAVFSDEDFRVEFQDGQIVVTDPAAEGEDV